MKSAIEKLRLKNINFDAIINCSYPRSLSYGRELLEVTCESFNENLSVHLGGYFNVMKQFGLYLKETGGGSIISFSSIYGVVSPKFEIYRDEKFTMPVEYSAIKSAIIHLSKYMAAYFKRTDVRFNTISPGGILDEQPQRFIKAYGQFTLSSRGGLLCAEDLTGSIKFLVSKDAQFINGHKLVIDDGWTL